MKENEQLQEISRAINESLTICEIAQLVAQESAEGASENSAARADLESSVAAIVCAELPDVKRADVKVEQLEYVESAFHVRFEVSLKRDNNTDAIDLWVIVPIEIRRETAMIKERLEIERKWIIDKVPTHLLADATSITQGYLSVSRSEEVRIRRRVRRGDDGSETVEHSLTVKGTGDRSRTEHECTIAQAMYDALLPGCGGRTIEKDRYVLDDPGLVPEVNQLDRRFKVELDVYKGDLLGLKTVEVEFTNEEEARAFKAPRWFGREVTFDRRFKNRTLACEGLAGILLRPNVRYERTVVAAVSPQNEGTLERVRRLCGSLTPPYEVLSIAAIPAYVGRVRRQQADVIWSCAALVGSDPSGDPSEAVLHALSRQTRRPFVRLASSDASHVSPEELAELERTLVDRTKSDASTAWSASLEEGTLSSLIEGQRFVDNDLLSVIERGADTVHVVTTTLEFDLGDLRPAVEANLAMGKRYNYYLPSLAGPRAAFSELRANVSEFRDLYERFASSIDVYALPDNYLPYYHEIVIYSREGGSGVFGFTYLERKSPESELELLEIPTDLLTRVMDWLRINSKPYEMWVRQRDGA